jgi:hypothetical protein
MMRLGQQPPGEETRFFNFDPQTTSPDVLANGWSGYERNETRDTFVWCTSPICLMFAQAHGMRDRLVRARMWAFRYPGAPPQVATAVVNGVESGQCDVGEGVTTCEFAVDKKAWREGRNSLRFEFAYAESPSAHIRGNDDHRSLAVAFDWLEIIPR